MLSRLTPGPVDTCRITFNLCMGGRTTPVLSLCRQQKQEVHCFDPARRPPLQIRSVLDKGAENAIWILIHWLQNIHVLLGDSGDLSQNPSGHAHSLPHSHCTSYSGLGRSTLSHSKHDPACQIPTLHQLQTKLDGKLLLTGDEPNALCGHFLCDWVTVLIHARKRSQMVLHSPFYSLTSHLYGALVEADADRDIEDCFEEK